MSDFWLWERLFSDMPKGSDESWVPLFRDQVRESLIGADGAPRQGWTVEGNNGAMRLAYRPPGIRPDGRRNPQQSITLPYQWRKADTGEALRRIRLIFELVDGRGLPLKQAAKQVAARGSNADPVNWPKVVDAFRTYKLNTRGNSERTWRERYAPIFERLLELMETGAAPTNGTRLVEALAEMKPLGSEIRWQWASYTNQLLRFGQREGLPPNWAPHAEIGEVIGPRKQRRVGVAIEDADLVALLDALPDTREGRRWRFAAQLMAVTGCRASELTQLRVTEGRFYCLTRQQRLKSEASERQLAVLPVILPGGGTTDFDVVARYAAGEELPEVGYGDVGQQFGKWLGRTVPFWRELQARYAETGRALKPAYCLRYRFLAACYRHGMPVAFAADLAGHTPATALAVYARFDKSTQRDAVVADVLSRIEKAAMAAV